MNLNHSVSFSLAVLKFSRLNMINQFINFEQDLYFSIINSSKGNEIKALSIEKVKLMWLNFHWQALELMQQDEKISVTEEKELTIFFAVFFKKLLSQFLDGNSVENTELFRRLINNKLNVINQLIDVGLKHTSNKNQLILQYEIEKLKYDSILNKIQQNNVTNR